jgi:hypothetical protein
MTEDFDGVILAETYEDEFNKPEKHGNKGCMTAVAILLAIILISSAVVPLARFIIRKDYERQVSNFPALVCRNLSDSGLVAQDCDPSLDILKFVPLTFPIYQPKNSIEDAMRGFVRLTQSAVSQPGCKQPELWTYSVASSFIGWKTEVEFFFCSGLLVERRVLVDGAPVGLPTYDL